MAQWHPTHMTGAADESGDPHGFEYVNRRLTEQAARIRELEAERDAVIECSVDDLVEAGGDCWKWTREQARAIVERRVAARLQQKKGGDGDAASG